LLFLFIFYSQLFYCIRPCQNITMSQKFDCSQLELKPIDFEEFARTHSFRKNNYKLTKTNPFTSMSDADWETYVSTRKPHFTSEPYYEKIPWEELQQLEVDVKAAGWELILRTTNNTAYCPGHVSQFWCQRTQWIFGLPGMQFLIHLTYNESKTNIELPVNSYFSLHVRSTVKLIERLKTQEELDKEIDDAIELNMADELSYSFSFGLRCLNNKDLKYDFRPQYSLKPSRILRYYEQIKPASGWVYHTGLSQQGYAKASYSFLGSKAKFGQLGFYIAMFNGNDDDEDTSGDEKKNVMATRLPPIFWSEWIENNRDSIVPGTFDNLSINSLIDSAVFPGCNNYVDTILQWDMDYQFLNQLSQSTISNWVKKVYYGHCGIIAPEFWNIRFNSYIRDDLVLFKKTCIIEGKKLNSDTDEWVPLDGYRDSLFQYKDIRLSHNAQTLIKQLWDFSKKGNQ